jgi:hypothetical protein
LLSNLKGRAHDLVIATAQAVPEHDSGRRQQRTAITVNQQFTAAAHFNQIKTDAKKSVL